MLEFLERMGFHVIPHTKLYPTLTDIEADLDAWAARRDDLPFEIDGLVIKINDLAMATS